jgi:hydrogenase-4 component F
MGGPVASFAGLLHMTVHSLTKSAIFFAVGHAAQKAGTQVMDDIRGLIRVNPTGRLGPDDRLAGHPRHAAVRRVRQRVPDPDHGDARAPVGHAVPAAGARRRLRRGSLKVQPMVFGETNVKPLPHPPALLPVFVHLGLVLMLGLYIPPYLADWYRQAARLVAGG